MGQLRQDFNSAVQMYQDGLSVGDVAQSFGVSRQSMWETLKRRGVEFRPKVSAGTDNRFYRGGRSAEKRARLAVQLAVEKGLMKRGEKCESCGSLDNIEGHHDDYNKPLVVRWLCHKCHFDWHLKNKAIPANDAATLYANKRRRMIEFKGKRQTLTEWSIQLGIHRATLTARLNRWPVERALTEPVEAQR
jgi:transposase-like protein